MTNKVDKLTTTVLGIALKFCDVTLGSHMEKRCVLQLTTITLHRSTFEFLHYFTQILGFIRSGLLNRTNDVSQNANSMIWNRSLK
jgi:hypothetical protein